MNPQARVDFYVIPGHQAQTRPLFVCRLAEKAYRQGLKVWIQVENDAQSRYLDDLLWTWRDGAFLPHAIHSGHSHALEPVLVGEGPPPAGFEALCINLNSELPAHIDRFERVIEILNDDEKVRHAGRARFMAHRRRGIEPNTIQVDT